VCVGLRPVKGWSNCRLRSEVARIYPQGERPARERQRVIRVQANGFTVQGDPGLKVVHVVVSESSFQAAQVGIECSRVARTACFNLRCHITEHGNFSAPATAVAMSVCNFSTSPRSLS